VSDARPGGSPAFLGMLDAQIAASTAEAGLGDLSIRSDGASRQVTGLLGNPLPRRMGGDSGQVHAAGPVLNEEQQIQTARERRGNTVSTWKKSTARIVLAWAWHHAG
jgi:hypothetical protein